DFPLEMSEEPEEIESKLTLPTEEPEEEEAKLSHPTEEPEEEEAKLALPTEEPEEEEAKLTLPTEEPEEEEAKLALPTEEPEEEEAKLSFPIEAQDEEEESARLDIPVGNSDEEEESARLDMPVASAEVEEASGLGILTGGDGEESDDKEGYALESVALEKPEEESPEDLKVASSDYFGTDHISSVKKDEEETPVEEVPEDVSFEENEVLEEEPTEPIVEETSIPTSPEGPAEETNLDRLDMNEMFKDEPDGFRFSEPEFKLEEPKNSLPEIHLEKALEMPGFGEVQTLDALPAEESVEFLELPTDDASEEPKKNGLFGGVFKKKQKPARIEPVKTEPKKTWKKPELATEMEEVPEPRPVILEPVEPVAKPTVTRPEPKWVIEEPIISKPEPKEETPEPKAETPEPIVTEPESKAETVESKPEVKATSEPEPEIQGGPKMVFDDEGNPHIVFPEDEAVDNPFSDMDFPDATIPESPMPDPKIIPDVPRVEFPEGPQTELTMNPDPDNKEKARPFRNPEAAERTPSGLTADEDLSKDLSLEASPNPTDRSAEKEPSASFFDDVVEPVGLSPDTMEYDGKNHKQTLLVVAIIIVALAVAGVGFLLFRNYVDSTYTEAIENANVSIARLSEEGIPTQEDFNRAMDDYNAVPYEKKNEVEHADILEKYKDVDLKLVRDIKSRIDSLKDDTPFSDVISVEEEFNRLTMQEKSLIDASRIEQLKTLDDNEKTALQAIKNIQDLLPDFDNFKILTVNVKDDTKMSISHRLKISYSYVDDEGTLTEKTTYISMMSADDDVAYRKAVNEGNPALYTEGTEDKEAYEKCESTEVNVDPNKLSYFLG
ncbi:MAG: hypothetical protein IKQ97_10970, partial [Eubacterium sp.]|nr:hypothetical protein [Eubacterium sp.]